MHIFHEAQIKLNIFFLFSRMAVQMIFCVLLLFIGPTDCQGTYPLILYLRDYAMPIINCSDSSSAFRVNPLKWDFEWPPMQFLCFTFWKLRDPPQRLFLGEVTCQHLPHFESIIENFKSVCVWNFLHQWQQPLFFFLCSSDKITNELVSIQKSRTRHCLDTKVFVPHSSFSH